MSARSSRGVTQRPGALPGGAASLQSGSNWRTFGSPLFHQSERLTRDLPRANRLQLGVFSAAPAWVDRPFRPPYAGPMDLQLPPELEARLTRLATETGRTVDQVAADLLASSIDHDEWFRAEVEKGRAAARDGRLLDHDDVAARMNRRYRRD